ncbi:MAG: VTT domain-containing protein [Acidobacteria bacterium]|nr:VTT domain-containing protein [Acidobacteriota bacterium]MBS1867538.1 VTT domain-containing protein [Acidobacteriota bacterium]
MHSTLGFLLRHGYVVLPGIVFAEQVGLPFPATPFLLAAGALAGSHFISFWLCLGLATVFAVLADTLWFLLGRKKGISVLQFLCRISLEPDSCVRRTEGVFAKQGARSLLVAKFIPGLSTVAPPLAGIFHMRRRKFLLWDFLGSLLWAGGFLLLGYIFSGQIEVVAERAASLGSGLMVLILGALAGYITWKFIGRQRFLRELRIGRITPAELKEKIDAGEELVIVDLRHSLDFEADPETIPGAFRMDVKDLEEHSDRLPPDREVILYCT